MINYAEELAYWYLRLNGFFLVDNFVIHREGAQIQYRSDADLIAVRFPHVKEAVGGMPIDFDNKVLFKAFDPSKIIGLIVEVKSTRQKEVNPEIFQNKDRMEYAINRFGFPLKDKEKKALTTAHDWVASDSLIGEKDFLIGKLLIHNSTEAIMYPYAESIDLRHTIEFIKDRFFRYKEEKWGARMFFPSSLMQYMIGEAFNHEE
jgi:hypothetical protein